MSLLFRPGTLIPLALAFGAFPTLISECGGTTGDDGRPKYLEHYPVFHVASPLDEKIPADAEVDPSSSLYVQRMVTVSQTGGFNLGINEYALPVFYADETTPRYTVSLDYYGTYSYCLMKQLTNVPIPDFAVADPGNDHPVVVVDPVQGCVYDIWGYNQNHVMPTPNAWWASGIALESDGIYHDSLGAGHASNHSLLNGAVWPDELAAGYIPHALTFGYPGTAVRAGDPVPPATHNDGPSTEPDAFPEGTHVQLNPDLDLDSLGLEPHEKVIARALQEYGMYLGEVTGGPIWLYGVSGQSSQVNAWEGVVPDATANNVFLTRIPVAQFRVLKIPPTVTGVNQCLDNPCGGYQ